jgi:nicotinate dehydrogenase subunit B
VKVVVKKNLVGVVADKPWQALQAAGEAEGDVDAWARRCRSTPTSTTTFAITRVGRDAYSVNSKDVDAKLQGATQRVKATYLHPYQMHGSLGSSCAVADVNGSNADGLVVDASCVSTSAGTTAMVLGLQPQNVRVIYARGSGCYGLNGSDSVAYDAAILSQRRSASPSACS